jgi:hypothetical protein
MIDTTNIERRYRRALKRRGLALQKSRTRNSQVAHYGCYRILDPFRNQLIERGGWDGWGMNLEQVGDWIIKRGRTTSAGTSRSH